MEAIILAGGFGTRLQSVVKDVPKPMADINGKPFLAYLLDFLAKQGFFRVILSVGYKKESIIEYFKDSYGGVEIVYADEDSPLGTGGAIKKALQLIKGKNVFILNGDTFFSFNAMDIYKNHLNADSKITIALKPMSDFNRYGSVKVELDRVVKFEEKGYVKEGMINAGTYLVSTDIRQRLNDFCDRFSFEKDFLEKCIDDLKPAASIHNEYFIDIGIPEDYERAKIELNDYI